MSDATADLIASTLAIFLLVGSSLVVIRACERRGRIIRTERARIWASSACVLVGVLVTFYSVQKYKTAQVEAELQGSRVAQDAVKEELSRRQRSTPQLRRESANSPRAGAPNTHLSREDFERRLQQASAAEKSGDFAAAFEHFVWTYQNASGPDAIMGRIALRLMGRLSRTYPPAKEWIDGARKQIAESISAKQATREDYYRYADVNQTIGENVQTLAMYDSLPKDQTERQILGLSVFSDLVAARRYADALEVKSFANMARELEGWERMRTRATDPRDLEKLLIGNIENIEVLVRAGRLTEARVLAERIVAIDDTPANRQLLESVPKG